jgi:hypothetical protein
LKIDMNDKYEELAYKLLESPEFWLEPFRIKDLAGFTYWTEVYKVIDILSNKDFLAKAKEFYVKYPTKATKKALENIKDIEEVIGTFSNKVLMGKRPWEMTRDEFYRPIELPLHWSKKGYQRVGDKIVTPHGEGLVPRDPFSAEWVRSRNPALHEAIVSLALQKGLAVPSEVLADYPNLKTPVKLPTFRGYTVDHRLREFRKVEFGKTLEFIPFDSQKGRQLLQEMEPKSVPDVLYASPVREIKDRLENLHKKDPEAFYRELDEIKKAIKERERGKIKRLPDISLTDLREIKKDAEALYR